MKIPTAVIAHMGFLPLISAVSSSGPFSEPPNHEYIPPAAQDSRSPCPGLNAMANHGFLPRSGKDIDLAHLQYAVKHAFNYAPNAFDEAFQIAINFNLTTTGNSSTIHLGDLALHDAIEMDGSLSRNDFLLGDNLHFDPVIWVSVANRLGLYDCVKSEVDNFVTVERAAIARAARVRDAMRANPNFNASAAQQSGSPGTTALFLTTMWNETAGAAPKTWVRSFFEEERIPYLLGFDAQSRAEQTLDTVGGIVGRILAVNVTPEDCTGQHSRRAFFNSRDIHGFKL